MLSVDELALVVGVVMACAALGISRASWYRRQRPDQERARSPRKSPARALSPAEREQVLDTLNSERFMDQPPTEVYARLLDDAIYLCSPRTMYRILDSAKEVRERRNQLRHPNYTPPQLLATAPNQVWTWDIERHEALTNLAVVKGHCLWHVAAFQKKLRAAGAGERW